LLRDTYWIAPLPAIPITESDHPVRPTSDSTEYLSYSVISIAQSQSLSRVRSRRPCVTMERTQTDRGTPRLPAPRPVIHSLRRPVGPPPRRFAWLVEHKSANLWRHRTEHHGIEQIGHCWSACRRCWRS
jgi:hypothetical protein